MNELLIVVAGVFVLCFMIGVNRGFIKIVASLSATLIVLVLVMISMPYVGNALREYTPLEEKVKEKCIEVLHPGDEDTTSRDAQISLIEKSDFPQVFKDLLLSNNNGEVYDSLGVTTFVDYVGAYMAKLFLDIVSFLLAFIVITAVVRIALYILDIIGHLPVIGGLNRLAGGVLGLGTGLIIVWVLFIAITMLYDLSISKLFLQNIEENELLQFLYNNNILMNYLTKFRV